MQSCKANSYHLNTGTNYESTVISWRKYFIVKIQKSVWWILKMYQIKQCIKSICKEFQRWVLDILLMKCFNAVTKPTNIWHVSKLHATCYKLSMRSLFNSMHDDVMTWKHSFISGLLKCFVMVPCDFAVIVRKQHPIQLFNSDQHNDYGLSFGINLLVTILLFRTLHKLHKERHR